MITKQVMKKAVFVLLATLLFLQKSYADNNKMLIIGIDGVTTSLLDYATVPNISKLIGNATYNLESFSTLPAFSSSGWATLLTGVSPDKHGVIQDDSFLDNHFDRYPSIVSHIKEQRPDIAIISVVRDQRINDLLNFKADERFNCDTDEKVMLKTKELVGARDFDLGFAQFSAVRDAGQKSGFLLREAEYVLSIQKIDRYLGEILSAIENRPDYLTENWGIYIVSTHGGYLPGKQKGFLLQDVMVPIVFSGRSYENKVYHASELLPTRGGDNILGIAKKSTIKRTFIRVPIVDTPLQGMDKYTIEMWIKPHNDNTSDPVIIGDKDWDSGGNPGFAICRRGSSWKINFADEKRNRYDLNAGENIEDGRWHHIAATFDKNDRCIVYHDGLKVDSVKLNYHEEASMKSPYDYLCLAQDGTQKYDGGFHWSGSFNEVRIWGEVLPQDLLVRYMNIRNIEKTEHPFLQHLNLYFKMDEIMGTTVTDFSGKGHHGEIVGVGSFRAPFYPIRLTDVSVNILNHFRINSEEIWELEGVKLAVDIPYRLFKVNKKK